MPTKSRLVICSEYFSIMCFLKIIFVYNRVASVFISFFFFFAFKPWISFLYFSMFDIWMMTICLGRVSKAEPTRRDD